jgi:hypothetical protein
MSKKLFPYLFLFCFFVVYIYILLTSPSSSSLEIKAIFSPTPPAPNPIIFYAGISSIPSRLNAGLLIKSVKSLLVIDELSRIVVTLPQKNKQGQNIDHLYDSQKIKELLDIGKEKVVLFKPEIDYGPLSKLIGVLTHAPSSAFILLADDDTLYHTEVLSSLYNQWVELESNNTSILAIGHSGRNGKEFHWDAQVNFPKKASLLENYCGGLYRASSFHNVDRFVNWAENNFLSTPESWFTDDILIGAWLNLNNNMNSNADIHNNVGIYIVPHRISEPIFIGDKLIEHACEHDPQGAEGLSSLNLNGRNEMVWSKFIRIGHFNESTIPLAVY